MTERRSEKDEPWKDPHAAPYVTIESVTKRFGDFLAVNNVSLKIFKGEIFCLLGGSGCGKTTLLPMLAGFEQPTSGRILIDGQDMSGIPPYERPVNMMFQSYALFPHMSVEGNVAFGLEQEKLPRAEIRRRVDEILQIVHMESFARRKPHQLSGGQRQRVALARSLVKRPKLLLLDEPLGALDRKLREHTQFELINIQEQLGVTFVIVTHDQEEAMTVADRIAVMNHGKLVQVATPGDIYEQPNCRYVADFIGDINILEAKVASVQGGAAKLAVQDPEAQISVSVPEAAPASGAEVAFAVRPEKMRIALDAPPADAVNVLKGEVWDIAYFGDWTKFLVKLDGSEKIVRVSRANMARTEAAPISWDDKVHVWFAPDAGVLLTG